MKNTETKQPVSDPAKQPIRIQMQNDSQPPDASPGSAPFGGSAHSVIPYETVAKALGMATPEPPKYPRCTCHSVRARIRRWKEDAEDALSGKYGDAPKGEGMDYWRGQRAVLYELDAMHDFAGGAMEEENAVLKDAMEALKDYVDGKRSDSENISAIINGALKLNAPALKDF